MISVLFAFALSASPPVSLVSDHVPSLNVASLCKATTETDKAMSLAEPQSFANCMRDETAAKQQLDSIWQTTSVSLRDQCEGEATAGGFQSYVDLLTCIQMTDTASASPTTNLLRGQARTGTRNDDVDGSTVSVLDSFLL